MSEVQKPVEETTAAAPATETTPAPAVETPAVESTTGEAAAAPAEASQETPAENTEASKDADNKDAPAEQPKEDKKEVTPASEGQLGYKAPGLVKGLRFSKRFFYFQDEPVEAKQLNVFHQHEKPAVANPIAAWASQTGKGLLFYTKRAEDKAHPSGVFNLAEATDITKEGSTEFLFKVGGVKHTFQATSTTERDSWVAALEAQAADAKAQKETITGSEGYKSELEKLNNPAAAASATKKSTENKEETKDEDKKEEPKKEEAAPAEESKEAKDKSAKSRSQSRKRTSLFGALLGKKEETAEEKKDEKAEEAKPAEASTEAPAEGAPATEAPAEAAPATDAAENKEENKEEQKEENQEESKEEKKDEKKAETPAKSKRASLFGNFFQKVSSPSQEKSEKEAAAPAESSVASTAPQLDNPVEGAAVKPIEPESVTAPAEGEAAKETPAQSPAAETAGKDKRRTSFFGNFGKKKGESSDTEDAEGKKANKLGGLFRKPSKAVKLDNQKEKEGTTAESAEKKEENKPEPIAKDTPTEEKPAEEEAKPAETSAATQEATASNNVASSTPVQAAA